MQRHEGGDVGSALHFFSLSDPNGVGATQCPGPGPLCFLLPLMTEVELPPVLT